MGGKKQISCGEESSVQRTYIYIVSPQGLQHHPPLINREFWQSPLQPGYQGQHQQWEVALRVTTDSIVWWKRHFISLVFFSKKKVVNFIWKVVSRCTFNAVNICGKDIPVWWLPSAKIKIHLVRLRHSKKKNKSGVEWTRGKSYYKKLGNVTEGKAGKLFYDLEAILRTWVFLWVKYKSLVCYERVTIVFEINWKRWKRIKSGRRNAGYDNPRESW